MSFLIENKIRTFHYLLVWLVYAFIHAICFLWVLDLPFWVLLVDAVAHAAMFAFFGILLWNVMLYGNYEKMPFLQRLINYSALALLILVLWVGVGYGLDHLFFGKEEASLFLPALPLYVFIGILLYFIIVLYFRMKVALIKAQDNEMEAYSDVKVIEPQEAIENKEETAVEAEELERIAVKSGHKIHVILVPDILYMQADGDYVHIFTPDGKYMKEQTMKYFEENLPAAQFVRVHRSFIVNVESISRIEQYEKQNQLLTLKNGHHIKVSLGGYKLLKSRLGL